ncbi:MAG: hypothetical protein M4579_006421 [Chaenotheca gracillima]|nr:MAG: hypothetical protein M4579_006421 [Chaenotheca gracillima]
MRTDPRIRQTWNDISENLESANQTAQANIFAFSHEYLNPCLSSVSASFDTCFTACFPPREERLRRSRARKRGRAENNFDFYDDWEDDDDAGDALLGWGNDELDRLLAGSGGQGATSEPYGRPRTMSYGARRGDGRKSDSRWRSAVQPPHDGGQDPTVIPKSSVLGFLGRLPWKMGKELRYKPSAADLQDRPGKGPRDGLDEPLLEEDEGESGTRKGKDRRKRSGTAASDTTTDSFRSRRDLFPSDDEDDAVPLDDEFAMVLERRTTGSGGDDHSSRVARKKPSNSRQSTRTDSSRETLQSVPGEGNAGNDSTLSADEDGAEVVPSMTELKQEEEIAKREEEIEVERRREAARRLARSRGLSVDEASQLDSRSSPDTGQPSVDQHPQNVSEDLKPEPINVRETPSSPQEETQPSHRSASEDRKQQSTPESTFVPARLPTFPVSDQNEESVAAKHDDSRDST